MRGTVRAATLAAACAVVAACGTSPIPITPSGEVATEAEYDRKVMRVRFKAN
jgi:hypothetical protein